MPGKVNVTFADYGGEKSTVSYNIATLAVGNIATVTGLVDTLNAAIEAVSVGLNVKEAVLASETGSGTGKSTDPTAQRELKWLVAYQDDVTLKGYQMEIPCPLLTANTLDANSANGALMSDALWTDFVAAFEAVVKSPTSGAVTVQSVRLVGRNL